MTPSPERMDAIREREQAATPGPWAWFGNTSVHNVYLSTVNHGRRFVMGFRRWGMSAAEPMFRDAPGEEGVMQRGSEIARYEVLGGKTITEAGKEPYRYDLTGFDSPDAEFIAHAREDVPWLLAELAAAREREETLKEALRDLWDHLHPEPKMDGASVVTRPRIPVELVGRFRAALAAGEPLCPHCRDGVPRFDASEGQGFDTWAHRYGGEPGTIMPCLAAGEPREERHEAERERLIAALRRIATDNHWPGLIARDALEDESYEREVQT